MPPSVDFTCNQVFHYLWGMKWTAPGNSFSVFFPRFLLLQERGKAFSKVTEGNKS